MDDTYVVHAAYVPQFHLLTARCMTVTRGTINVRILNVLLNCESGSFLSC